MRTRELGNYSVNKIYIAANKTRKDRRKQANTALIQILKKDSQSKQKEVHTVKNTSTRNNNPGYEQ